MRSTLRSKLRLKGRQVSALWRRLRRGSGRPAVAPLVVAMLSILSLGVSLWLAFTLVSIDQMLESQLRSLRLEKASLETVAKQWPGEQTDGPGYSLSPRLAGSVANTSWSGAVATACPLPSEMIALRSIEGTRGTVRIQAVGLDYDQAVGYASRLAGSEPFGELFIESMDKGMVSLNDVFSESVMSTQSITESRAGAVEAIVFTVVADLSLR